MKWPASWWKDKVLMGFAASVLAVAGLAATSWKLADSAAEASRWVAHTYELLDSMGRARAAALDIELTVQNYRLAPNPALLVRRDALYAERERLMARIQRLSSDNPLQQRNWAALRQVTDERIAIGRRVEVLRNTEGAEAANRYVASAPLQETRERLHRLLSEMEGEEHRLLSLRIAEERAANRSTVAANIAVVPLLCLLLAGCYLAIRRQEHEAESSRRALAANEERLRITLSSIGDGVLVTDERNAIIDMNPAAQSLTAWPLSIARGRLIDEVFHLIDEPEAEPQDDDPRDETNRGLLISRHGQAVPVASNAAPVRDADGRINGKVLVFHDESGARRARKTTRELNELLQQRVLERSAQLRESEAHLESVVNGVPAMIAFIDAQQRYVYANRQYMENLRLNRESVSGLTVREVVGKSIYANIAPLITRVLAGETLSYDWQPAPDVWHIIKLVPHSGADGNIAGYYVLGTEISERKRAEQQIRMLNENLEARLDELQHLSRALRTLSAGNRSLLHARDEPDLLDGMCKAIVAAGGYRMACVWYRDATPGAWLKPMAQSGHPGGMEELAQIGNDGGGDPEAATAVAIAVRTGATHIVRQLHEDAAYAPWGRQAELYGCCIASPLRVDDEVVGALAIYSGDADDFSEEEIALLAESADDMAFGIATFRARAGQRKARQAIHRMTWYDELTGLPNTNFLTHLIQEAIERRRGFCLLQIDVERVRDINESLGFVHGDALLKQFGERLAAGKPKAATLARLRSNAFGMLLPDCTEADAIRLAQALQPLLAEGFPIADLSIEVASHVGISCFPDHGDNSHDLFRHMDIAVRHARMRRVAYAVFEPSHDSGQAARLLMVGALRQAIEQGGLQLHLQPKVDMRSGAVCGVEALVRWHDAQRGLIRPAEFIGLAEQTMLIKPLTEWVIDSALRLNANWRAQGCALPVAINLSVINLRDEALPEKVDALLAKYGCEPGMLEMELTESMLMDEAEHALQVLGMLRGKGIPLHIDDFGTGYSSLNYLSRLPVDCIKIDRSFVHDMLDNEHAARIVRSTIDLAHDLGHKVIAEGVESLQHWNRLMEFGCDIAQGYLIAKPMAVDDFQSWLKAFVPPGMSGPSIVP